MNSLTNLEVNNNTIEVSFQNLSEQVWVANCILDHEVYSAVFIGQPEQIESACIFNGELVFELRKHAI